MPRTKKKPTIKLPPKKRGPKAIKPKPEPAESKVHPGQVQKLGKITPMMAYDAALTLNQYITACKRVVQVTTQKYMKNTTKPVEFETKTKAGKTVKVKRDRFAWKKTEEVSEEDLFRQIHALSKVQGLIPSCKTMLAAYMDQQERELALEANKAPKSFMDQLMEINEAPPSEPAKADKEGAEDPSFDELVKSLDATSKAN